MVNLKSNYLLYSPSSKWARFPSDGGSQWVMERIPVWEFWLHCQTVGIWPRCLVSLPNLQLCIGLTLVCREHLLQCLQTWCLGQNKELSKLAVFILAGFILLVIQQCVFVSGLNFAVVHCSQVEH